MWSMKGFFFFFSLSAYNHIWRGVVNGVWLVGVVLVLVMFAHNNFENWCLWKEVYHNWENAQMLPACWLEFGAYVLLLVCGNGQSCVHACISSFQGPSQLYWRDQKGRLWAQAVTCSLQPMCNFIASWCLSTLDWDHTWSNPPHLDCDVWLIVLYDACSVYLTALVDYWSTLGVPSGLAQWSIFSISCGFFVCTLLDAQFKSTSVYFVTPAKVTDWGLVHCLCTAAVSVPHHWNDSDLWAFCYMRISHILLSCWAEMTCYPTKPFPPLVVPRYP